SEKVSTAAEAHVQGRTETGEDRRSIDSGGFSHVRNALQTEIFRIEVPDRQQLASTSRIGNLQQAVIVGAYGTALPPCIVCPTMRPDDRQSNVRRHFALPRDLGEHVIWSAVVRVERRIPKRQ